MFLGAGAFLIFIGSNFGSILDTFCTTGKYSSNKLLSEFTDQLRDFDATVGDWPSQYMCTLACPCPAETNPELWDEGRLNRYNRTKLYTNGNSPTNYTGFYLATLQNGSYTQSYKSFYECYQNL